ncbi:3-phosphoshikimate 1-carboxyvinyltransferase [Flavobacterium sp.]|uniref:3-phosphoshikimate 1-carboxyvinyltransferase n=1 Tax=Flavobacterium sp. TaxID=239 RepID=UPI00260F309B|nr:3-phosphoshikimate 1-carboxyvinyltransferase [Flavobacterium sp.]
MDIHLPQIAAIYNSAIKISGSKSETNRLLLLRALYPEISLENISTSDDSDVMIRALSATEALLDIHHAGTAMRFLTAYLAIQEEREVTLTGSSRMKQRPIQVLVDALRELGAEISYEENEGFPPLKIKGKKLQKNQVTLAANVSSQYISALLLIAPKLENGLQLTLEGEITSVPYIKMTLDLLHQAGVKTEFIANQITVFPKANIQQPATFTIESDWSSASYYYSIVALSEVGTAITLSRFKSDSLQGDSALTEIYKSFGVETTFENNNITLRKVNYHPSGSEQAKQLSPERQRIGEAIINYQLNDTPDIAQTIAVTCFGLGLACHLAGLHTLKIKETDRLTALQNELQKLGAKVMITYDSLTLEASETINSNVKIATYNDHRMAMAFAPLALRTSITIEDAEVVSKSYPNFWNDLKSIGFEIEENLKPD